MASSRGVGGGGGGGGGGGLVNYGGEIGAHFEDYESGLGGGQLKEASAYFSAPEQFRRSQINSYGGELRYFITHTGYEFEGGHLDQVVASTTTSKLTLDLIKSPI